MAPAPDKRAPEPPQAEIDPQAQMPQFWRAMYLILWNSPASPLWGLDPADDDPEASPAERAGIMLARAEFTGAPLPRKRDDPLAYHRWRYLMNRATILERKKAKRDAAPKSARAVALAKFRTMTPAQKRQHKRERQREWNAAKYAANRDTKIAEKREMRKRKREQRLNEDGTTPPTNCTA
jgi:hypothetical protein